MKWRTFSRPFVTLSPSLAASVPSQLFPAFVFHKPKGVICTTRPEPEAPAARLIVDLLPAHFHTLYPHHRFFGRLDRDTSGLILFAWEGARNALMNPTHCLPQFRVEKRYRALVAGDVSAATLHRLMTGFPLKHRNKEFLATDVAAREVTVVGHEILNGKRYRTELDIVITRGIRHHIRRMMQEVNHRVKALHRLSIGPIILGELGPGDHRELTHPEYEFFARQYLLAQAKKI